MGKKTKKEHRRISTNHRCLTLQDNHISQRTDWVYIVASIKDLTLFHFQIEKKLFVGTKDQKIALVGTEKFCRALGTRFAITLAPLDLAKKGN